MALYVLYFYFHPPEFFFFISLSPLSSFSLFPLFVFISFCDLSLLLSLCLFLLLSKKSSSVSLTIHLHASSSSFYFLAFSSPTLHPLPLRLSIILTNSNSADWSRLRRRSPSLQSPSRWLPVRSFRLCPNCPRTLLLVSGQSERGWSRFTLKLRTFTSHFSQITSRAAHSQTLRNFADSIFVFVYSGRVCMCDGKQEN